MDGILQDVSERLGWTEVVAEAANGVGTSAAGIGPDSEQIDKEVSGKLDGQHLRDDVQVGDESGLEDDGDVGGVEQLDWVGRVLATVPGGLDGQIHTEALKM